MTIKEVKDRIIDWKYYERQHWEEFPDNTGTDGIVKSLVTHIIWSFLYLAFSWRGKTFCKWVLGCNDCWKDE